MYPPL